MRGRCSMCAHNSFNKQGEPLVWCALSAVLFRIHLALDLALSWKVLFEDAVHHGNHFNKSRPSQVQQTHCIHTSENAEEITIDQCKGNKKPDACFPMCCAHARGVSRMFFSPERIRDCTTHCIKRCCQSQPWPVLSIADEFQ